MNQTAEQNKGFITSRIRGRSIIGAMAAILAGLAWNQGTVWAQLPTGNLIQDSDLEPGTVLHPFARPVGPPWIPGEWNAEDANVINRPDAGISPLMGDRMHHINATVLSASQVNPIIDVSPIAGEIDAGNAVAPVSIWSSAPAANVSPSLRLRAGVSQHPNGTLVPVGESFINAQKHALSIKLKSSSKT